MFKSHTPLTHPQELAGKISAIGAWSLSPLATQPPAPSPVPTGHPPHLLQRVHQLAHLRVLTLRLQGGGWGGRKEGAQGSGKQDSQQ